MNIARQDANGVVERPDGGTYGFGEGANLARLAPDDARINVDNYQVFATVSDASFSANTALTTVQGHVLGPVGLGYGG